MPGFDDQYTNRVRCPIHGFIHYSDKERELIDDPLFRRLRFIRQLALTEYVYPGATHSRFEHSLGVMEVATRIFDRLRRVRRGLLEDKLKEVLEEDTLDKAKQLVRLAGLLHDVGHVCFSHAAEKHLIDEGDHETLSRKIISCESLLGKKIDTLFWDGCAEQVADIMEEGSKVTPQLLILKNIISGEMDADRSDYLLRDSHHCGVDYGRFDFLRLVESIDLIEDPDRGSLEIAINTGGIHALEGLIIARYQMTTQVYAHRIRRIYDHYLREYFKALKEDGDGPQTVDDLLKETDFTMMTRIVRDSEDDDLIRSKWAKRIHERRHHKQVHTTGVAAERQHIRKQADLFKKLEERFPSSEFIRDEDDRSIHRFAKRDEDPEDLVEMKVLDSNGDPAGDVCEQSQILEHIPHRFRCGWIFFADDNLTSELADEVKRFVAIST